MKIGIIGCAGRMGKALIEEIQNNAETRLAGGAVRPDSGMVGADLGTIAGLDPVGVIATDNVEALFRESDAVIDFSNPETSLVCAGYAAKHKKIHVIGTTGFSDENKNALEAFAKEIPVVWSYNMSIGINLLAALTRQVAHILDDSYDIEIVEMHHYQKVDAPSGTALLLGEAAAQGRGVPLGDVARKSREGIIGARPRGEIGFSTIRGGDVVGEHTVILAGDGERIELIHKASSRKIFAKGAVRAALWAGKKKPGLYSMKDVLEG